MSEEELKRRSNWLSCLEQAGVDNWHGMEYAQEMYEELYGDDEDE